MIKNLDQIYELAKSKPTKKLAVVWVEGKEVLEAVIEAKKDNLVEPILIGPKTIVNELQELQVNPGDFTIINCETKDEAATVGVTLIRENKADILMKGLIDTNALLKAVVNRDTGIRTGRLLSHVALVSFPTLARILFCSDIAMNISPTVEQKIEIIYNLLRVMKSLGYEKPRIGLASAIEKVNPKMQSSVEAAEIANYFKDKDIEAIIDGPFALDNLVSIEAAKEKNITSPVAGVADGIIFPDIDAGNIFYKTAQFLAGATSAGIVVGAKAPICLTSRADTKQTKLYSIALAVVYEE
ncbi:MAG TPA: bifunctional enoyl-CoA hydratase/phosphate acetyltransferase [Bacilli bacterium]|nr:bifunctional enoyl-CoA hydratase/phosphate acetyltransferase [Bacilli bacterium]